MAFVFFACIDPEGNFSELSYGGNDIESCLDVLNQLTASGWHLVKVKLVETSVIGGVELPVDAFTDELMGTHLAELQRTWEALLEQPTHFSLPNNRYTISRALELQERVRQEREDRKRRIVKLFDKADRIQQHIMETKSKWGVE